MLYCKKNTLKFKRQNLNEVVAKMGKKNSLIRERQEDISGRARHREGQPSAVTSSKENREKESVEKVRDGIFGKGQQYQMQV